MLSSCISILHHTLEPSLFYFLAKAHTLVYSCQSRNSQSYTIRYQILHPSQIICHCGFSRYIDFAMHLDMRYVQIHCKTDVSRKAKTTYNLEQREYNFYQEFYVQGTFNSAAKKKIRTKKVLTEVKTNQIDAVFRCFQLQYQKAPSFVVAQGLH